MDVHFSNCDFSYLRPPKDVFNVSHSEYYIRHGEGKKAVRKIFANGKYYDDELTKFEEFKALIANEKLTFPPGWTDNDTFRYMYSGKLDLKKSLKILKGHFEWRASPERGFVGPKAYKLMEDGVMYLSGRDKQYRPIIVVNAQREDLKRNDMKDFTQTIAFILDTARKYYFVPGKVENWVIIIESNGAGVLDFPTKLVKAINDVTAGNYTSTLDKIYIMNPSSFIKKSWTFVQSLLDPETATKIAMLTKEEFPQLLEKISRDQLEQCYGGTLPARTVYWPPTNTLNQPPYTEDTAPTSQNTSSDKAVEKETVESVKHQEAAAVVNNEPVTENANDNKGVARNGDQKSRAELGASVNVIVSLADVNKEKRPREENLEEIEEWNFKGRIETENDKKRALPMSARLDDSDEQVEVKEVKHSNIHTQQNILKPLKSQRKDLNSEPWMGEHSKAGENVLLEENESGAICGLCSPSSSQEENSSVGCNIF